MCHPFTEHLTVGPVQRGIDTYREYWEQESCSGLPEPFQFHTKRVMPWPGCQTSDRHAPNTETDSGSPSAPEQLRWGETKVSVQDSGLADRVIILSIILGMGGALPRLASLRNSRT